MIEEHAQEVIMFENSIQPTDSQRLHHSDMEEAYEVQYTLHRSRQLQGTTGTNIIIYNNQRMWIQ